MRKSPELSIVIPSYNEAKNIYSIINEYSKFVSKYNFELIYINNGSTDGSSEIFNEYSKVKKYHFLKIVSIKKNVGYGHGIMTGLKVAKSGVVAYTHADMQTPPKDVFRAFDLYKKLNNPEALVKGKRRGRSLSDRLISKCMALIATLLLRVKMTEINAQPKLFNKKLIKEFKNPPNDFSLDIYVLFMAKKLGYGIKEIKVDFLKRRHGKSKWSYSFSGKLTMIKNTFNYIRYLSKSN